MPGRSSADPDDLDVWVAANRGLDSGLAPHHGNFVRFQNTFSSNTVDGGFDASSLIRAFRTYLDENEKDSQWTSFIAGLFRQADSSGGVVGLPDSVIAAGLRAAGLSGGRQSVTFDDPIVWGAPPTSGYANDPVNTASGNFVEIETDLEFGGLLGALRFSRTYNSRSDRVGPFGVGWASWASARLRAAPDGAHWEGPDGQRAVVPVVGDGSRYRRVVGIQGLVVPGESGLALEWFGGRRWEFDAEGLLVAAQDGPGTRVRFEYADSTLVALVHEGGTRLDVCWDGERIVALRCSDGRRVAYRYDGAANLVEVEGPGGRRRYELDDAARVLAVLDADGVVELRNMLGTARSWRRRPERACDGVKPPGCEPMPSTSTAASSKWCALSWKSAGTPPSKRSPSPQPGGAPCRCRRGWSRSSANTSTAGRRPPMPRCSPT